jgi:hypothetical protein
MTPTQWGGLASVVIVVGLVVLAFRRSKGVKRDPNRKTEDWPNITQGGSGG